MLKDFQNKWHEFIHMLSDFGITFFHAAIYSVEQSGGQFLRDAATQAAQAFENENLSNEEKFSGAYKSVVGQLEAQAIPIVINAIRIAIETAVANLKQK